MLVTPESYVKGLYCHGFSDDSNFANHCIEVTYIIQSILSPLNGITFDPMSRPCLFLISRFASALPLPLNYILGSIFLFTASEPSKLPPIISANLSLQTPYMSSAVPNVCSLLGFHILPGFHEPLSPSLLMQCADLAALHQQPAKPTKQLPRQWVPEPPAKLTEQLLRQPTAV